jgi:hypothetical protein
MVYAQISTGIHDTCEVSEDRDVGSGMQDLAVTVMESNASDSVENKRYRSQILAIWIWWIFVGVKFYRLGRRFVAIRKWPVLVARFS